MSNYNEKSVTTIPATATELVAASLATFCDNDTVGKKIADYVDDGFHEILDLIQKKYMDSITQKHVPSVLEFRLNVRNLWELSITVGTANACLSSLDTYSTIEEHEVFRSRYKAALVKELEGFGFTPWSENKEVLILSINPRSDCGLI